MLSSTYGNNCVISYQYDKFNRVKKLIKENNEYSYLYNNNGVIYKLSENDGESYFLYDEDKRLKKYTNNRYYTISYEDEDTNIVTQRKQNNYNNEYYYDNDNNITKQKLNLNNESHFIENTFNRDGMVLESNLDGISIKYMYDELLRVTSKNINNSYETEYEYLSIGNRTSTMIKSITSGNTKYSYKYDKLNNVTDIYLNNTLITHYEYDIYNELISDEDYVNNIKTEYTYDNEGNILTKVKENISTNENITTDTYEYNDSSWEDLLTKYNDELITYDEIGNSLTIGSKMLTWINGRQLNTYEDSNISISYKYNLNGIRTEKVVNGVKTEYYLQGKNIIYEKTGNDIIYYLYDSDGLIGLNYDENVYYYEKNLQGDIIAIKDSNNNTMAIYEYDSFGKIERIIDNNGKLITDESNIALINQFRYRSYFYDNETELYYLNSRYYNPKWGRFINADGIIGANESILGQNIFLYTDNNYVNAIDLSGKFPLALPNPIDWLNGLGEAIGKTIENAPAFLGTMFGVISVPTSVSVVGLVVVSGIVLQQIYENNAKRAKKAEDRDQNVYVLVDKFDVITYVGRTKSIDSAKYRHSHNLARKDLRFHTVATNLTYMEARGLEQILILRCDTKRTEKKKYNQINGVNPNNLKKAREFKKVALTWLEENEIPC